MKKIMSALIAAAVILTAASCKKEQPKSTSDAKTVTITSYNGAKEKISLEVPFDPQRIAILDLASLDIIDNLGIGDRVVGTVTTSIDYLTKYPENKNLVNLGNVKTADMEAVMECEPDIIFIGGRLSTSYDALSEIAPVVLLETATEDGLFKTIQENAATIATIFGLEDEVSTLMNGFSTRIEKLHEIASGKNAIVGMCTNGGFNVLGDTGRCSIIGAEIGFKNIGTTFASSGTVKRGPPKGDAGAGVPPGKPANAAPAPQAMPSPTHGNEVSFEFVVKADPEYMFIMDRDAAIGTNGAKLAKQIVENELIKSTNVYKSGKIVYLEHSSIWYTAEGGITAFDYMLKDLESVLLK